MTTLLSHIIEINRQYAERLPSPPAVCLRCGEKVALTWNERCQWIDVTPCACSGKGEVK